MEYIGTKVARQCVCIINYGQSLNYCWVSFWLTYRSLFNSNVSLYQDLCLVQMNAMECCILCHCVIYNPSRAWWGSTPLRRTTVLWFYIKSNGEDEIGISELTFAKWWVFLLIFTIIFLSNDINLGQHKLGETNPALLRFVCHQWNIIHHSKFQYILLTDWPMYWSLCIKIMCEVCKRQCFKSLCFYVYHLKLNKQ